MFISGSSHHTKPTHAQRLEMKSSRKRLKKEQPSKISTWRQISYGKICRISKKRKICGERWEGREVADVDNGLNMMWI